MSELAATFEAHRGHLRVVAYRMLGSTSEADDAVQEAWLKLSRADASTVDNLRGWLTTVTARVCLDSLRSRKSRREEALDTAPEAATEAPDQLADSVGQALMLVLNKLDPAERLAFVLHDSCEMSFDQIAAIIGKSSAATRQLASRARRRIQGASNQVPLATQRVLVESFIAALRAGDIEGLIAVLDPEAVVRVDGGDVVQVTDARTWATGAVAYKGAAQHMRPVVVDGMVALALAPGGKLARILVFGFAGTTIHGAEVVTEADALAELTVEELP